MVSSGLEFLAYAWIILSGISFFVILLDMPQQQVHMRVMKLVWPLTALYMGPIALYAYWVWGRVSVVHERHHDKRGADPLSSHAAMEHTNLHPAEPSWRGTFLSATHCGAGCSLGDIIGEILIGSSGLIIGGSSLLTSYVVDFVLAFAMGIAFQYYSIVPMEGLTPSKGIRAALKADTLSLVAFEVGMFAWMAVGRTLVSSSPEDLVFWFMMQVAMMFGFATSYPANWALIRRGIKHAM